MAYRLEFASPRNSIETQEEMTIRDTHSLRVSRPVPCLIRPFLCILLTVLPLLPPVAYSLPSLESGVSFPVGTFVVPMDEKQAERVVVFGFIHALLRSPNPAQVFRVIEPPDIVLTSNLTASPESFTGGPFLLYLSDTSTVAEVKSRPEFKKVTIGTLASPQVLNSIMRITEPSRILIVKGLWGRSDLTLDAMQIPYDITTRDDLATNPSMISSYSLIVIDSYGWAGSVPSQVADKLRSHVNAGNEVIFTDIALKDMNSAFPGYVTLWGPQLNSTIADSHMYNPPKKYGSSTDLFQAEYPSQYYNPAPRPNEIRLYVQSAGYVVSSVSSERVNDVRILVDSNSFGLARNQYAVLAFYFPYGDGIVEGFAFNPQQQTRSLVWANGYYTVYQLYGNMILQGNRTAVSKYDVRISLADLPSNETTALQVDGIKIAEMHGNDVQVLPFTVGTSHTFQVDRYVSGTAGYRYYCASSTWITGVASSHTFSYVTQVQLEVDTTPSGAGSVSLTPSSTDGWYDAGTPVQAIATALSPTYVFANWVLDGSVVAQTSSLTVSMNSRHSLTAVFGMATSSSATTEISTTGTTGGSTTESTVNLTTETSTSLEVVSSTTTAVIIQTRTSTRENTVTAEMFQIDSQLFTTAIALAVLGIAGLAMFAVVRLRRARTGRMAPRICRECGFSNPPYTRAFCVKCGSPLESSEA